MQNKRSGCGSQIAREGVRGVGVGTMGREAVLRPMALEMQGGMK